jgi:hypothetical protein
LQQSIQDHKCRDVFRCQLLVTSTNNESQNDIPNKSSSFSPLPTDPIHGPGTKECSRNRKQCRNELLQSNCPDIMIWHDGVDYRRHNAIWKIYEAVQKERATGPEGSRPVFLNGRFPWHIVALVEEASILHF